MSNSVKFMIGVFSLVVSLMVVMAWFDGQAYYISPNHMTAISKMGDYNVVTGTQSTGETSTNLMWGSNLLDTITSWIDFDFSFWYSSIESGWTQTTCEANSGIWDNGLCKFPNQWDLVHTMVFRPIGWGVVLSFIAIGIGKLFGVN